MDSTDPVSQSSDSQSSNSQSAAPVNPPATADSAAPVRPSGGGAASRQKLSGADLVASLAGVDDPSVNAALEEAMAGLTDSDRTADVNNQLAVGEPTNDTIVSGRIANIGSEDVLIDFGGKSLGTMPKSEFSKDEKFAVGDSIEVAVLESDERTGLLNVSRRKARQAAILRELKPGTVVTGLVTGMNKGGLEVNIEGLRGFIPASQVDVHFLKDISELIGKTVSAEVTKYDAGEENIILSRRKWLMKEQTHLREKALGELELGQLRRGKVKGIAEYGAFIDLGGVDGLLHVTDMSWGRVNKPEDILKVGDEVEVKIIKLNKEKNRVSLSLKQAQPDPWTHVAEKFPIGAKVSGRVVRLQAFGAFVELEPGVDGLLPLAELSWTRRVHHPKEVVKEGDVVEVGVLSVDAEKKRIGLSLKAVTDDPWSKAAEKYVAGTKITGKVVRTTEFGAFVALEDGIDGLIHISELSDTRIKAVTDKVKPGQEVEVRVLGVDTTNHKISLSMKTPPREPTPEELAERAAARAAAEKEAAKRREKSAGRRGGLTISWDQGLGSLDPSKFARS